MSRLVSHMRRLRCDAIDSSFALTSPSTRYYFSQCLFRTASAHTPLPSFGAVLFPFLS